MVFQHCLFFSPSVEANATAAGYFQLEPYLFGSQSQLLVVVFHLTPCTSIPALNFLHPSNAVPSRAKHSTDCDSGSLTGTVGPVITRTFSMLCDA